MDGRKCDGGACAVYPPKTPADPGRVRGLRRRRRGALRARRRLLEGARSTRCRRGRHHRRARPTDPADTDNGLCPIPLPSARRRRPHCPRRSIRRRRRPSPHAGARSRTRSPSGRSGTSRTRPSTSPRRSTSAATPRCSRARPPAIRAVDPKRRDHPRRDVGPELGARGRDADQGLPARSSTSSAPTTTSTRSRSTRTPTTPADSVAQLETRAQGAGQARRRPRGRHVGDRDRLGRRAARASNPYVKGLDGQARVLTRALSAYQRKAPQPAPARGVLVLVARQEGRRRDLRLVRARRACGAKNGDAKPAWRAFVRVARG